MYTFFVTDPNLQTNPLIKQQDLYSDICRYQKLKFLTFWNEEKYVPNFEPSSKDFQNMNMGYEIVHSKPSSPYFYYINANHMTLKTAADVWRYQSPKVSGEFFIPDEIIKDLDDDKCRIILDDTTEGTPVSWIDEQKLHTFLKGHKHKVIFVNSDYNKSHQSVVPTSYRNLWEKFVASRIYRWKTYQPYIDYQNEKLEHIQNQIQVKYKAICKNRILKSHRLHLCRFIEQNGLSNDINYSCGMTLYQSMVKDQICYNLSVIDWTDDTYYKHILVKAARTYQIDYDELVSWCQKIGTKKLDFESSVDLNLNQVGKISKELFQAHLNCYFEIVTETLIHEDTLFHSEKSFMPILFMNPFVLFGEFGSVNALRELGYDMFDDIINHDYDTKINEAERAKTLFNEISRLCDISHQGWCDILQSIQHRLINNRQHLKSCYMRHNKLHQPIYKNRLVPFEGVSLT